MLHDVYAYGVIAPSTLIELGDDFPAPGGYAEIAGVYPSIGGEAAEGAYVLARLGVATKLNGNLLGDDDSSARVLDLLSAAGVDCRAVGTATRRLSGHRGRSGYRGRPNREPADEPETEWIRSMQRLGGGPRERGVGFYPG